ncbi:MAG TPA: PPOX class F420-dependent oxidoreductase [Acidimicrobiia bacterium]|nr:PPOX class F420-dependent oxidoreductase [Acidimicrobiia bacterium]
MDAGDAREFIARNHRAVLATYRADGSPQMSPVAADVDPDGLVVISTRETAMKAKNLRRDPRASVCVFSDAWYGPWVLVDGRASVVSLPEAMDGLVDYYRRVAGEHPDWADYRAALERERRVLLRITIDRVGPNRSG